MASLVDTHRVLSAIRLGWSVAEVRGRSRPDGPPGANPHVPKSVDYPLPLRIERTPDELRIEAEATLDALARRLLYYDDVHATPEFGHAIDRESRALAAARRANPEDPQLVAERWEKLAKCLWEFDAHAQDRLTAVSDTQACGYQLGRGLSECYWALDPNATDGWTSWGFLFDHDRCRELTRLVGRLSHYLQPFTASAISGSLEVWKLVAKDPEWREQPTVSSALYQQIRNWYELLVLGQDPSSMVAPYRLIRNWRVTLKAVRTFLPQVIVGGLGVGALFGFIFVVTANHPPHWAEALTGALGALGVSFAGITAKLKNQAQAMSTRLSQDAYTDLLASSITTVPAPPKGRHRGNRQAVIERTVRNRVLTPTTPFD